MFNRKPTPTSPFSATPSFADDSVPPDWATAPAPAAATGPDQNDAMADYLPAEPAPAGYSGGTAPAVPGVARNVLHKDVSVVGTLRFSDDLLVDGTVEGEITSDGVLTVGTNATIQAGEKNKVAVRTKSAIIHGKVSGDVVVTDRVELASTAELVGNITAAKLAIQEGAAFVGYCTVGKVVDMPELPSAPSASKHAPKSAAGDATDLFV